MRFPGDEYRRPGFGRVSSRIWLAIIVFIAGRFILHNALPRVSTNTVPYQGHEFKMRKTYSSYEDYKEDPDNLDTNELDRIEQAIVSAKVPESFAGNEELIHFMIYDLRFPGYGMGSLGGHSRADDGTKLLVETVEIPQKQKDRVLTFSQSGEQFKLVDDFVYSAVTNRIRHVELKSKVLLYYDRENRLIREKQL